MRDASGRYDEKKGSPFEILALQMQMYATIKEPKKLKVSTYLSARNSMPRPATCQEW
jgi:hypothetical protein